MEAAQEEASSVSMELFKIKNSYKEVVGQLKTLWREKQEPAV